MQQIKKNEQILFYILLFVHLIPVIFLTPFVTLDGPVHLYNARLFHDLLFSADPITRDFFELNPVIEPNMTGHLIMSFLLFVFPPFVTEKLVQLFILILFATGYRRWILTIEPAAVWVTWLVFPLLYNFAFLIGFFNFLIGLSILPFFMTWWIKISDRNHSIHEYVTGIILLLLIYYSHLLIFLLAGALAGIHLWNKQSSKNKIRNILFLSSIALPGILQALHYLVTHGSVGYKNEIQWVSFSKILEDLGFARYLILYDYASEKRFTVAYTVLITGMMAMGLRYRTIQKYQTIALRWVLLSILLLFLVPDSFASGGIITQRLELWLAISVLLFLSTLRIPDSIALPGAAGAAFVSLFICYYHSDFQKKLNHSACEFTRMCIPQKEPAVLLPVNYSHNWMEANLAAYAGAMKKWVVLDNYEADYRLFPVVWKDRMKPSLHAGNHAETQTPCLTIKNAEDITGHHIDFISFWAGKPTGTDSCSAAIRLQLQEFYMPNPEQSKHITLYLRN